jgi:hypothetical protein
LADKHPLASEALNLLWHSTARRVVMMPEKAIAPHTVLASVTAMQKEIKAKDARLRIRQQPANWKAPNKTNGKVKNNAEANRFLLAIVE